MAKIDIEFLRFRKGAGGRRLGYWIPSATLARSGWKPVPLGPDESVAIQRAQQLNADVEAWRQGKTTSAGVKRAVRARSFGDIIRRYRASHHFTDLKPATRSVYANALAKLETWAGDYRPEDVTPKAAQALYDALRRPAATNPINRWKALRAVAAWNEQLGNIIAATAETETVDLFIAVVRQATPARRGAAEAAFKDGLVKRSSALSANEAIALFERLWALAERLHTAHRVMRVLSTVWKFAAAEQLVSAAANPAALVRKKSAAPRSEIWPATAIETAIGFADGYRNGNGDIRPRASIGAALLLAHEIGQREADILALTWRQWDGTHLKLRQKKTGAVIHIKATAPLRERLNKLDADNRASERSSMHIIINEETGRPYYDKTFQRKLREILDSAIEAGHDELGGLEYRDLRRTAVVRLGETGMALHLVAAVSGHTIEQTKNILEVYLPRTGAMADMAIDILEAHRAAKARQGKGGE